MSFMSIFGTSENVFRDIFDNLPKGAINLKASRVKENMSQKELSEKSGIPLTLISKHENGHRIISEDLAKKLVKIFKTNHKIYLEKSMSYQILSLSPSPKPCDKNLQFFWPFQSPFGRLLWPYLCPKPLPAPLQ